MNANYFFEAGDLIAVFGGEIGKDGKTADRVSICVVVACGEKDLIVEDKYTKSYSRSAYHKVPKNICHKLAMNPDFLSQNHILVPQVGDLVLSYAKDSFGDDPATQATGILYKTTYVLGKPHKSTLICGGEMKEVSHESLIVLQSNKK